MEATAALVATLVVLAAAFLAADSLAFLAPYRAAFLARHGSLLLAYAAMLGTNAFVLVLLATRRLALRRTGDKLRHLEREGALAGEIEALTLDPTE